MPRPTGTRSPRPKKVQYRRKRFWRFLDDAGAIKPACFWRQSGGWMVEQFAHRPHLVIALNALPKSQPPREGEFLKELLQGLPRERKSLIGRADRGYARP
ncbi:MAG: hypothetical protein NZT92_12300 [Abditibacteriales bacterium]|nr:hypothetical protein [Abditibacteriales bacterium]